MCKKPAIYIQKNAIVQRCLNSNNLGHMIQIMQKNDIAMLNIDICIKCVMQASVDNYAAVTYPRNHFFQNEFLSASCVRRQK